MGENPETERFFRGVNAFGDLALRLARWYFLGAGLVVGLYLTVFGLAGGGDEDLSFGESAAAFLAGVGLSTICSIVLAPKTWVARARARPRGNHVAPNTPSRAGDSADGYGPDADAASPTPTPPQV